jgi:hypothetical protein
VKAPDDALCPNDVYNKNEQDSSGDKDLRGNGKP